MRADVVRDPKHRLAPTRPVGESELAVVHLDDTSFFPDWVSWGSDAHRRVAAEVWFLRACAIASWRVRWIVGMCEEGRICPHAMRDLYEAVGIAEGDNAMRECIRSPSASRG